MVAHRLFATQIGRQVLLVRVRQDGDHRRVRAELVGKLDLTNLRLPARQVVEHCPWVYKGNQCQYKPGKMFNLQNVEVTDASQDQCAKNLRACELRFPKGQGIGPNDKLLPFGGFPGARLQV